MNKAKRNKIIMNAVALAVILGVFLIINVRLLQGYKQRFMLVADDMQYCYGIDSLDREKDSYILKGWFFEPESVLGVYRSVNNEDTKQMIALIPVDEASVGAVVEDAIIMTLETMHDNRPDVNEYFSCEYNYSKCGFLATIDCNDIDLQSNSYRIAIKPDADLSTKAVLTNLYITDKGLSYTDPRQSPELDTVGTDLDKIVNEGVRVVSRPDFNCYLYQLGEKLYWIADENCPFNDNGATFIEYQMYTTQFENLPQERLENNWFFSNIGDYFEMHEITNDINCGKYRVSVRNIPREYSVVGVETGYLYDGKWIWREFFKPIYGMLT